MLSESKIIALYCIVDDMLKCLRHKEDVRVRVSDSEVITTAFVSVLYFGGHLDNARCFMKLKGYIPNMLDKSRFCRRLHRLSDLLMCMFFDLGQHLKDMAGASDYTLDSFPVAVCQNVRINRCQILKGKAWRGKHAAMARYFYGVRVQVLTLGGVPVEFCLVPGRENDSQALLKLPLQVAPESRIYMDAGYTNYQAEDEAWEAEMIKLMIARKSNSRRKDQAHVRYLKDRMRKRIETCFSEIKTKMLSNLHAVTQQGFLLKVALFVIAIAFDKVTAN
ncbi:MAG TPA: IS982 family transposase [Flavisolibacter sp.]